MDATTYTGTGAAQNIVNQAQFKPDLVWVKLRSGAASNRLVDSNRGATLEIYSNTTDAEYAATQGVTAFNSNGFALGTDTGYNGSTSTYVGWQWQAGQGSNTTNTTGTITSTVSVNATAGFSIVKWAGNGGASATIGHGLGVAPQFIMTKDRSATSSWIVQHNSLGWTQGFLGISTVAATTSSAFSNNTAPSSTVFTTAAYSNNNGDNYVAYCWAPIAGFSQFGSYTGNGSTDGPFVYLGFRPKFVLAKSSTSGSENWFILDSSRNTYNVANFLLNPNSSAAEETYSQLDFLSNGFKIRNTGTGMNANGATMIYMAFAENPLKFANAR
jgi:hypothetical protein